MAVTLGNFRITVNLTSQRAFGQRANLTTQAHRAADVGVFAALFDLARGIEPFGNQADDRIRRVLNELSGVRLGHTGHIAGEFDDSELHTETDTEVGHLVFAGVTDGGNLAFRATTTKAPRHQNGINAFQNTDTVLLNVFRIEINDIDLAARMDAGVLDRFDQRLVGLGQIDILADESHGHFVLRMLQRNDQVAPDRQIGGLGQDIELVADNFVEHLVVQHARDLVDRIGIETLDNRFGHHVAEQGDLATFFDRNRTVSTAEQDVRLDTDFAQFLDGVLGRLGF